MRGFLSHATVFIMVMGLGFRELYEACRLLYEPSEVTVVTDQPLENGKWQLQSNGKQEKENMRKLGNKRNFGSRTRKEDKDDHDDDNKVVIFDGLEAKVRGENKRKLGQKRNFGKEDKDEHDDDNNVIIFDGIEAKVRSENKRKLGNKRNFDSGTEKEDKDEHDDDNTVIIFDGIEPTKAPGAGHSKKQKDKQCDCFSGVECRRCHRGIITVHKMGVTLVNDLLGRGPRKTENLYWKAVKAAEITKHEAYCKPFEKFRAQHLPVESYVGMSRSERRRRRRLRRYHPAGDYRHILLARNLYDAVVSGYLYHKGGHECWKDYWGNDGFPGWLFKNQDEDWEKRIDNSPSKKMRPWPSGSGRDLCTYLQEESEADGMAVYLEWVMDIYFRPMYDFWKERQEKEQAAGQAKTLIVCFEQLTDQVKHDSTLQRVFWWLYPALSKKQQDLEPEKPDNEILGAAGGHATRKNPAQKIRLMKMILEMDEALYGGFIKQAQQELGSCSSNLLL